MNTDEKERRQAEKWIAEKRIELGLATLELSSCNYRADTRYTGHSKDGDCNVNITWCELLKWLDSRDPVSVAKERLETAKAELDSAKAELDSAEAALAEASR